MGWKQWIHHRDRKIEMMRIELRHHDDERVEWKKIENEKMVEAVSTIQMMLIENRWISSASWRWWIYHRDRKTKMMWIEMGDHDNEKAEWKKMVEAVSIQMASMGDHRWSVALL